MKKAFIRTRHQKLHGLWIARSIVAAIIIVIWASGAPSQDRQPSIMLKVQDEQGGLIAGAQATLKDSTGKQRSGVTSPEGKVVFSDLPAGNYAMNVSARHFTTDEQSIQVTSGGDVDLNVTLHVAGLQDSISVFPDNSVAQVAEYVGGSLIIRGDALLALQGPGGLEAFLRALTLRTTGPFGPQALVNGFEDGQLPPTSSIREIRINDNPFSAEYSSLGLGRIEILTKPGSDKFHFSGFGNLGDADLNTRNPFAPNKERYQSRLYGGNISGPILPRRATFFLDFNKQEVDSNAIINATAVDPSFAIVPLRQTVVTPQSQKSFSPRVDYQMSTAHTWALRYADNRSHASNAGVGEFSLRSRAQESKGRAQTFQLTETAILSSRAIDETRAQFVRTTSSRYGNNSVPTINVPGAFTGGGAETGKAKNSRDLAELQNVLSFQTERHMVKIGVQVRHTDQADESTQNFGGTYTFVSRLAPQLNSDNQVIMNGEGTPVMIPITTIEAYRRTILFLTQGLTPEEVRELGGGAGQFSITAGKIHTDVRRYEMGAFIQDNWRLRSNFTLSGGVRYEHQSDVSRRVDFAPRLAFAWGIGKGKTASRTVVRGGVGAFYDRIPESVVLRARQLDGQGQRQYFVSDNSILDLFPTVPTPSVLESFAVRQSTIRLARDLRAPYTLNASLSVERQLLRGVTVALTASKLRGIYLLRSRSINAPLPGTYDPSHPETAIRPFGDSGAVFQYESSGVFAQRQLLFNIVYRAGKNVTMWSTYTLRDSKSNTDSPDTFPSNSYDLRAEYGNAASQAAHTVYWGGWLRIKGGFELTPLVLWRSKTPFNITTGRDANGDSLFTDRPAFATDLTRPSVVATRFGTFDLNPLPGQQLIPRNYGFSSNFFIANLRISKAIPLRDGTAINLSIQGTNIFNHTNPGVPIGNLGSPLFGTSNTSAGDWGLGSNQAGNRRIEAMLSFSFH